MWPDVAGRGAVRYRMEIMERSEVSIHEVLIADQLRTHASWMTNADIAAALTGRVTERTVRAHTLKLVRSGLVDQAEVFPAHRFRWSEQGSKRNRGYFDRLGRAAEVFGLAWA